MARHLKRTFGIAAGSIAVIGLAWFAWNSVKQTGPGAGFVSGNGRIEATEIDVATTLAGRVIEIFVNEGDFVAADQTLARMQIDSLDAQKDEASAQYRQAIAAVTTAEAKVEVKKSDTLAASAVVGQRNGIAPVRDDITGNLHGYASELNASVRNPCDPCHDAIAIIVGQRDSP